MISAWSSVLWLLAFLSAASRVNGLANTIYTSAATYCAPPRAIIVDRFQVVYYRENRTISFDIIAASVEQNLSPTVSLSLKAYGLSPVNVNFDLCSVAKGFLCPLPTRNFSGSGVYQISQEYTDKIPAIAFSIPDLEATATVSLKQANGEEVACLQTVLSNGKTTKQDAVSYATGGVAAAALVGSFAHSFFPHTPASVGHAAPAGPEWGVVTILQFFQSVSVSGLLSLQYPHLYQSFTLNFGWALGLIKIDKIERAIDKMRLKTGSDKPGYSALNNGTTGENDSGAATPFFNVTGITGGGGLTNVVDLGFFDLTSSVHTISKRQSSEIINNLTSTQLPTVDNMATGAIQSGIGVYTERLGIPDVNAWATVFFVFLLFCAIMLATLLGVLIVLEIVVVTVGKRKGETWIKAARREYGYFATTNALRIVLISYATLSTFAFYQFTIRDSWLTSLIAAVVFVVVTIVLAVVSFYILKTARHPAKGIDHIYEMETYSRRWATLYEQYKRRAFYFFIPIILATLAKSAFVSFGQGHPWVQVIGLLVVETALLIAFIAFRPFRDRGSNAVNIFIQVARVISYGTLIAFIESVGVKAIPRTVIGIVLLAIQAVVAVVLIVLTVINMGWGILWARKKAAPRGPSQDIPSPSAKDTEKASSDDDGIYPAPVLSQEYPSQEYPSYPKHHHDHDHSPSFNGGDPKFSPGTPMTPGDASLASSYFPLLSHTQPAHSGQPGRTSAGPTMMYQGHHQAPLDETQHRWSA